ncbi:histone deacetylase [Intrasporangium sp. YIM S08009]|uniref:histone deacetylase n=1 Tax=Intrasporangium zincisolvens TaxID=3080018 RepID=UPI002B060572|nr:histone deacetylase [Intrasporangium sp. YIM S08009]
MDHVWYAAYGSNLSRDRFTHYLAGGRPSGAARGYDGARDASEPLGDVPLTLEGQVYFAWQSRTWGGGIAFYDPDASGRVVGDGGSDAGGAGAAGGASGVAARAYLVTREQFSDVASQEMRHPIGRDLPLSELFRESRTAVLGPGRYETLHVVGEVDAVPVVTFTASWEHASVELNPPVDAYLRTIATGLAESHGWDAPEICDYLLTRPGSAPTWTPDALADLVTDALCPQPAATRP